MYDFPRVNIVYSFNELQDIVFAFSFRENPSTLEDLIKSLRDGLGTLLLQSSRRMYTD